MGREALRGALFAALHAAWPGPAGAQEIAPLRITAVDGHVSVRHLTDTSLTGSPTGAAGGSSRQGLGDLRTEVFIMTHGYVYHPNLLSFDAGAGPVLQRGRFATESGETVSSGALYNLSVRASLLRDKPYRGAVFFEHLNPVLSIAPGQVISQESTRYGFEASLLDPFTPVPVTFDAVRQQFRGRGTDRVIDDDASRVSLRASRSYGGLGMTQVHYEATRQDSQSGSPNLPIQASSSRSEGLNLDTRLRLGAERQHGLVNLVSWNSQRFAAGASLVPDRRDVRVLLDLRANHGADTNSFGTWHYSASDQGELSSALQSVSTGISHAFAAGFSGALGAHAESSHSTQFEGRGWSADGSLRHEAGLGSGRASASYGLRFERREQQSVAPQTSVYGERVALAGTAYVTLARQRVIPGSIAVSNAARTQVFIEGIDYQVSIVGMDARLQRLIGGSITDGQEVLVDYAFDVGGTYAFDQRSQNLGLTWTPLPGVSLYFRYAEARPHLLSGTPSFLLNTLRSRSWGARADRPFGGGLDGAFGGSVEYEDRRETISPHRRQALDLYAQFDDPVFGVGNLRLTGRSSRVRYDSPGQDVNLRGYDLRYFARTALGIDLSADAGYERDSGTAVPRSRAFGSLRAQWRYRKATLSAQWLHVRESQGGFGRTRTQGQLLFRRDL